MKHQLSTQFLSLCSLFSQLVVATVLFAAPCFAQTQNGSAKVLNTAGQGQGVGTTTTIVEPSQNSANSNNPNGNLPADQQSGAGVTGPTTSQMPTQLAVEYPNFGEAFRLGVQFTQKAQWDQAIQAFESALKYRPDEVVAMSNLAVAYWEKGLKIQALAAASRALEFHPSDDFLNQTVEYFKKNLVIKDIPHSMGTLRTFQEEYLKKVSLDTLLIVNALILLLAGLSVVRVLRNRKISKEAGEIPQQVGIIPFVAVLLLVTTIALTGLKVFDQSISRAMVLEDETKAFSAPSVDAASLLILNAGLKVEVSQQQGDWVQVTYPGAGTGWVEKAKLYPLSKDTKW